MTITWNVFDQEIEVVVGEVASVGDVEVVISEEVEVVAISEVVEVVVIGDEVDEVS